MADFPQAGQGQGMGAGRVGGHRPEARQGQGKETHLHCTVIDEASVEVMTGAGPGRVGAPRVRAGLLQSPMGPMPHWFPARVANRYLPKPTQDTQQAQQKLDERSEPMQV